MVANSGSKAQPGKVRRSILSCRCTLRTNSGERTVSIQDHVYLYVEDDPMSRDALRLVLTRVLKVEHVFLFEDSADFMTRLRALPIKPNVILLDIQIQPYTGFDMLKMLRNDAEHKNAHIIALTASVMNEEVETLKQSGFNAVIGKPIHIASFPKTLESVLRGESVWQIFE